MAIKVSVEKYPTQFLRSYFEVTEYMHKLDCLTPYSYSDFRTAWRLLHKNSDLLYSPNQMRMFEYIAFDDESYLTHWLLKYSD